MLEEIKAKMEQKKEEIKVRNMEFIQELNMKRSEFDKAEEKIWEQKLIHQRLKQKGPDFIAEIELGNAPDMAYVTKNIHISEEEIKKKEPVNAKAVAEEMKGRLEYEE